MDSEEILDIVDQDNNVIGQNTRFICYEQGLLHRAVNIFIFNSKGEVFLQKRSAKKLKYPLFWDLSCSEHIKSGEGFEEAAKRGLKEELGIETDLQVVIPLHHVDSTDEKGNHHDNELIISYKGLYDEEMKLEEKEILEGKFFNILELNKLIEHEELKVTPWFLEDWKLLGNFF